MKIIEAIDYKTKALKKVKDKKDKIKELLKEVSDEVKKYDFLSYFDDDMFDTSASNKKLKEIQYICEDIIEIIKQMDHI